MKFTLVTLICSIMTISLYSQDEDANLVYDDYIYNEGLRSVKFHVEGFLTSMPILQLDSGVQLELSFDDLNPDVKRYVYTVVHCTYDWKPSAIFETEYIDGFTEEEIDYYEYSFKTTTDFTHFRLAIPNEDMSFTKSGNYLLKVYEDEDEKKLVLTRRFVIWESVVKVFPRMMRPAMVSKGDTHQEIDFVVDNEGFEIRNPLTELKATIIQNNRWDNAIIGKAPRFSRFNEQSFDYQDEIIFPAGKEFRYADLRSLKHRSENVESIGTYGGFYEVTLFQDKKRLKKVHLDMNDINGNYIIETADDRDHDLESDYANVLFRLYSPSEFFDCDVYLIGGLTDWQLRPEFKLQYNTIVSSYVGKVKLKQGYYNYLYAVVPIGSKTPDFDQTEGDWYETNNEYTIFIYYRPFAARYDRLIGFAKFGSRS